MSGCFSSSAICLLTLMKLKGIGRGKALKILGQTVEETGLEGCRDLLLSRLKEAGIAGAGADEVCAAWRRSEDELGAGAEHAVSAVAFYDEGFPARLREMPDPPAVLFVKGSQKGLHAEKGLAVVGTREPTKYGRKVAHRSARTAAEAGYAIVSGLAHGCDTHAHEGCAEAGGVGVVVLAHGLDRVYPVGNRYLADRLLQGGGCLTSEYPVGTAPARAAFADRDRIQSGLSDGVLVIETDVKGGTMHTVRFAAAQSRPVACIDHADRLRGEKSVRGNRMLIEEGRAQPIADGDALMAFLADLKSVTKEAAGQDKEGSGGGEQASFAF